MKIKFKIPTKFHFKTKLKIRVSDLNYGGHLGNDSVLCLALVSWVWFFFQLNVTERNFFNVGLLMADSAI